MFEVFAQQSCISMSSPLVMTPGRKLSHQFAAVEAEWIITGDNRLSTLLPYAPTYAKFSDDGQTLHGAYGPKVAVQLDSVIQAFVKDPNTRQAVINIWRENPPESRDIPCTLSVQWLLRDGILQCFDTMRSSDVWLGWPYDIFSFSMLSHYLALRLRAAGVKVDVLGYITLTAASCHLYEDDRAKAMAVLGSLDPTPTFTMPNLGTFENPSAFIDWLHDLHTNPTAINNYIRA